MTRYIQDRDGKMRGRIGDGITPPREQRSTMTVEMTVEQAEAVVSLADVLTQLQPTGGHYQDLHSDAWERGVHDLAREAYSEGCPEDAFDEVTGRWIMVDTEDSEFFLVDPTVIDDGAIGAFRNGGCGPLAQQLSYLDGYTDQVVVVYDDADVEDVSEFVEEGDDPRVVGCTHIAAIRDDGAVVDIDGVHTMEDFQRRWGGQSVVMPVGQMVSSWYSSPEVLGPDSFVGWVFRAPEQHEVNVQMAATVHATYRDTPAS